MLLELPRWVGEYTSSRVVDLVTPSRTTGEGRPVLVIPGFSANDKMTGRLRGHLNHHGFNAHGWGQGSNIGLTDSLIDGLESRFTDLVKKYEEPVSVVGWSFGGVLARHLAHTHPENVRQIVCLGSPWRADGERTRATAMFEKSRKKNGISERARPMIDVLRGNVPVPTTAVWSKSDGIVPWRGCRVDEDAAPAIAENVEIVSSHVGMVASPIALAVVVDRLSQQLDDWQPFTLGRLVPARSAP